MRRGGVDVAKSFHRASLFLDSMVTRSRIWVRFAKAQFNLASIALNNFHDQVAKSGKQVAIELAYGEGEAKRDAGKSR